MTGLDAIDLDGRLEVTNAAWREQVTVREAIASAHSWAPGSAPPRPPTCSTVKYSVQATYT